MKFSRFHGRVLMNFAQDADGILQSISSCLDNLLVSVKMYVYSEMEWCCFPEYQSVFLSYLPKLHL